MRPNRENSIVSSSQPNLVCRPSGTPGHSSHENVNRAEQNTADAGSTSSNQSSEQCRRCSSINSRKWGGGACAPLTALGFTCHARACHADSQRKSSFGNAPIVSQEGNPYAKIFHILFLLTLCLKGRIPEYQFDCILRDALSAIVNCNMNESQWRQARLPVKHGGLGVRSALDIALPAYMSSLISTKSLTDELLSNYTGNPSETINIDNLMTNWSEEFGVIPQKPESQKNWDEPNIKKMIKQLVEESDQLGRAVLVSASAKFSRTWLDAIPSASIGTRLENRTFQIAAALRIGSVVCSQHECKCGALVDVYGRHPLACKYSCGRHPRQSAINDVIRRALISSGMPAILEPVSLDRGDGKRPDGITSFPYARGKSMIWDATVTDTFASSNLVESAISRIVVSAVVVCGYNPVIRVNSNGLGSVSAWLLSVGMPRQSQCHCNMP